jgi:plastocyanin
MSRALCAIAACCALALLSACGSSAGSSTSTTPPATAPKIKSGGLKANTTPKYAAPAASTPVQSGTVEIAYRNIAIAPDTPKVKLGSTIRWTNFDSVEHNVTSSNGPLHFTSGNFGEGRTFTVKATRTGVIHYLCTIHPTTMNGTIDVVR